MKNRGTEFEKRLGKIHGVYQMLNVARIEKVAPPVLVLKGRMIMLKNPWLDFAGTWTEQNGCTLIIEAKLTEKPRLNLCQDGGLSENQYSNLWAWKDAGAAVGLVWFFTEANTIRFLPLSFIAGRIQDGKKSILWEEALEVPATSRCPWDYLAILKN